MEATAHEVRTRVISVIWKPGEHVTMLRSQHGDQIALHSVSGINSGRNFAVAYASGNSSDD